MEFELSIRASDTVDTVKRQVEAQQGLCAQSHRLLLDGRPLASSKSLADYGINKGAVLELAPYDISHTSKTTHGSPLLSSPDHRLVRFPASQGCSHAYRLASSIVAVCR